MAVAGRDPGRTLELARAMEAQAVAWEAVAETPYDVLVHCTPVGSEATAGEGEPELVIPAESIRPGSLVVGAVYRPLRTPLLAAAQQRNCLCVPGAEWFVRQAAAQFRLFTGQEADDSLLRASFEGALNQGAGGAARA